MTLFYLSLDYNDYAEIPDGLTSPEGILTLHSGIFGLNMKITLQRKWNFPLRISLVSVKKSAENCGFVRIYYGNL